MNKQLFELGQIVATPGALELLDRHSLTPMQYLQRHGTGDHGQICEEDKEANNEAIWNGTRVLSSYQISKNEKLWVITEADRSSTCLLLPEEY